MQGLLCLFLEDGNFGALIIVSATLTIITFGSRAAQIRLLLLSDAQTRLLLLGKDK
jgi:hypothetical protein